MFEQNESETATTILPNLQSFSYVLRRLEPHEKKSYDVNHMDENNSLLSAGGIITISTAKGSV